MTDWTFSNKHNEFHCWGVAKINFIYGDTLKLKFENHYNEFDKSANRFSSTIAQLGTYSGQYEWKNGLRIGDQVDAFTDRYIWKASTILNFKEQANSNGSA